MPNYIWFIGISQKTIRLWLAEQEEAEAASGTAFIMHEEISASRLITMGLDYEIQQWVVLVLFKHPHANCLNTEHVSFKI